jgi:dynein heavy chain 1
MAMTRPDRELIAQVMLFPQGFRTAESLSSKIVPFFNLCDKQLSPQPHYNFGLRALKAVLSSAGVLKRERLQSAAREDGVEGLSDTISEQIILIQSVTETTVPKLVADDVPLLTRFAFCLCNVPYPAHDLSMVFSRTSIYPSTWTYCVK